TYSFGRDALNNQVISRSTSGFVFFLSGPLQDLVFNGSSGSDTYNIEALLRGTHLTINGGTGGNCFHITPTTQSLANIAGRLTLNGGGNDILDFFDTNNPNRERYTFDSVPSMLSLATDPSFSANWTGMAAVYLLTNGHSFVDDPSTLVNVDPLGGPPC